MELARLNLKEAAKGLKNKQFSSRELTDAALTQIAKIEPKVNAYLTVTEKLARKQAEKIDRLIAQNQPINPVAGIPVALKDTIVTKGIRTTAGSKILAGFDPPYSSTVFDRLQEVGAVLLGKTNLDEFAMGASTENSAYKLTKNPWDKNRVPGGSSGGSAVAVATDMCVYALGSDTGGSVRQPASFCGVVGLKPTYGRVSRYGLIAMASSLDQIGPLTKTVEDAALVLRTIAGIDKYDSTTVAKEVPDYSKSLTGRVKNLRIGVPREYFGQGVTEQVKDTVKKAITGLESLGAKVVEISLPRSKEAIAVYYLIMPSEVSANLARFDGIRYGRLRDQFGAEVKRRIMLGTYALSSGYYDAYYLKAAKVRTLIIREFQEAFKKVDIIAGPTSPVLPFKIGERASDPLQMYLADMLTVPVNLAGLPGISVPCGLVSGLPVGLQLLANHWEEEKLLRVAHTYEQNFPVEERPKL